MKLSRKEAARAVFQRRVLIGFTALAFVGVILWLVAVCTDYWYIVDVPQGAPNNRTGAVFLRSNSGLWRICTSNLWNLTSKSGIDALSVVSNSSVETTRVTRECKNQPLFPAKRSISRNPEIDETILDYNRTEALFAVISLFLMTLGVGFSLYTFKETRYMYKRLAGSIHFLSTAAVLVVLEVSARSIEYEREHLPVVHPKNAVWRYGFSYVLAWTVFVVNMSSGFAFMACSKKRKHLTGVDAYDDWGMDDEPHFIGR